MFCVFILIFGFVAKTDGFFFGNSGGGGGGCSCPPAPPPPVCQQQACPPPPSCGPPPQQFVPQFQPQVPFQGQGFLPPPPPPPPPQPFQPQQNLIPQGFGNSGYAVNQGPPPVQPGPPQQNFVPYEQPPPPPPPPAVQIPSPVPATNNENYDYEHFAQKTSDSYASNEQQVEVEPSARNAEQPLDESDPNNVFLPGKTLKKTPSKPSKKIRPPPLDHSFDEDFFNAPTTTRAPATTTTTTTTTTTPAPPKTTTLEDIYDDDKLPDIDDEYYENSRNPKNTSTKNMTNDRYMPLKKLKSDILTNDYSENSFKTKVAGVRSRIASELTDDNKCGDPFLRRIMTENIVASPTISKQLIFTAGKQHYNKSIDVVCSKNKFSYTVVSTKVFCEVTVKPVTCFAFFQPANLKKHRRHV